MKLIFKLAWRNIWRNKRRSILTLLAVAFATMSAIAMRGVQLGTYAVNIKNAVRMYAGFMQVQKEGYQKNPSLNKCFKAGENYNRIFESIPEIKGFAPRVIADGLISYKENSLGTGIFGIDPGKEKNVTKIIGRIEQGRFFTESNTNEIVVGYKMLENLDVEIGDEIVILAQGYDGSLGNMKFKIVGTVKMGTREFDAMATFMGIKSAQELLALYNRIHAYAINLGSLNDIPVVKQQLEHKIENENIAVLSWDEVMPDFKQSIEFDNISGILFLLILMIIVAFGILNTVLMSVTERFKEFGVTLSIGMEQIKLVFLVLFEILFITLIGIVIGDIIGWGINYYILQNPIEFSGELAGIYEEYGFLPVMESSLDFTIFFNNSLLVMCISLLASIYPLLKVYNLEPLKGIRYT